MRADAEMQRHLGINGVRDDNRMRLNRVHKRDAPSWTPSPGNCHGANARAAGCHAAQQPKRHHYDKSSEPVALTALEPNRAMGITDNIPEPSFGTVN